MATGRAAIGTAALVAPTTMARPWVGAAATTPASRLLARTMGGRDLALGLGCLRALAADDAEARPWIVLGGMADAVDAAATVMAFATLPRRGRWAVLALTLGAVAVSFAVAGALSGVSGVDPPVWGPVPDPVAAGGDR